MVLPAEQCESGNCHTPATRLIPKWSRWWDSNPQPEVYKTFVVESPGIKRPDTVGHLRKAEVVTVKLRQALDEYYWNCKAKNLSEHTLRWYASKLEVFHTYAEAEGLESVEGLRPIFVHKFADWLATTPSLNGRGVRTSFTIKGYIEVIKGFLAWAEGEDMIDGKVRSKIPNPKVDKKVIKILTPDMFERLLRASDHEPTRALQLRDKAILCLLLATGIRASELCGLRLEDVNFSDDYLLVRGKGSKQREVGPMGQTCLAAIRRMLRGSQRDVSQPLFVSHRTGGALTPFGLDQLLKRLRDHAGDEFFAGIRVSAHTFRHTFAVNFLKQGGNIKQLQLLLGHTSLAVTQRYLEDFTQRDARSGGSVLDKFTR